MTDPSSSDAKNLVSKATPKLPHERDESNDGDAAPDRPEIQQAYDDVTQGQRDTSKAAATDEAYNKGVLRPGERRSGVAPGRDKDDPAAEK